MSSSGHGQSIVRSEADLEKAFNDAMEGSRGDVKEIIIEEFIHFDSEFTLLTVTQKDGPTLFCPPIGHVQKGGDYRESWQPFAIPEDELRKAEDMAEKVTRALIGAGIWGVEFFLTKQGEVIFSELSPRPHDTGMVTLGHTTNLSEFELHFRKEEAHFGRRMGVVLCYGEPTDDTTELRNKAKRLAATVLGTDPYMDK